MQAPDGPLRPDLKKKKTQTTFKKSEIKQREKTQAADSIEQNKWKCKNESAVQNVREMSWIKSMKGSDE